jgi:hypothetical protein
MARDNAGGGHGSKVVVEKPVKTGRGNLGVSVGSVSQLGNKIGNHVTADGGKSTNYRGEGPIHQGAGFRPAEMGNAVAAATKCGVGGSRTIYSSGSQGTQGPVNPGKPSPSRDILSQFGDDYRKP